MSLGQIAVLALGAWVAARLLLRDRRCRSRSCCSAPGLITMVLGTLVGLPALRLSGLYLALITLMLAGAITVVLTHDRTSPTAAVASSATPSATVAHRRRSAGPRIADERPGLLPLLGDRGGR